MMGTVALISAIGVVIFFLFAAIYGVASVYAEEKSDKRGFIIYFILFIISVMICAFTTATSYKQEMQMQQLRSVYNNGVHQQDNGHWDLLTVTSNKSQTFYIYKCSKCDATMQIEDSDLSEVVE